MCFSKRKSSFSKLSTNQTASEYIKFKCSSEMESVKKPAHKSNQMPEQAPFRIQLNRI